MRHISLDLVRVTEAAAIAASAWVGSGNKELADRDATDAMRDRLNNMDFAAVINPPHATILAVGAGEQRPAVIDGTVKVRTQMTVTLSCDHRAVDGALGAQLLQAFKELIEEPALMMA